MLTVVEGITRRGTSLVLPLEDENGYFVIREISGLDPVKATISSSSFAQIDGETYNNSRREPRNIVLKLDLDPDYVNMTVKDLRDQLYSVFMPETEVLLRFRMDDNTYVDIWSRVETCEVPLFTQEPTADISLMCLQPDFIDPVVGNFDGTSVVVSTEVGAYSKLTYTGTVDTGLLLTIQVNRDVSGFTFSHKAPDGTVSTMVFAYPLLVGDKVEVSTAYGSKYARVTRGGVPTSVLYALTGPWVQLSQGDNYVRLYMDANARPYNISYTRRIGGL